MDLDFNAIAQSLLEKIKTMPDEQKYLHLNWWIPYMPTKPTRMGYTNMKECH